MTRRLYHFWIALFLFSCTAEEPTRSDTNLIQNLTSSIWEISFFIVDGTDQSSDFEGVSFVFLESGQVEAFRGTQLLAQGNWSTGINSGRVEFELSFASNPTFEQLSANWFQEAIISNRIIFRKDQTNSEDILTFEK
ncbi:hypothetical protein [Algoriphagus litoralis]|uniref:hypothetical protein n=1 Tax=Algoriphagus litoralis TaxID=2202829 RepID=UPI000DBA8BA8|nr:hypothetical protein [Algoriphagus litoralis]